MLIKFFKTLLEYLEANSP